MKSIDFFLSLLISFLISFHLNAQVNDSIYSNDPLYPSIGENQTYEDLKILSHEDALLKYPSPFRHEQFDMKGGINYERMELLNIFPAYQVEKKRDFKKLESLFIKEVSWHLDGKVNVTVWYKSDSLVWKPFFNRLWYKGTMF